MKVPGPDHPITIEHNPRRVRVVFNGCVVANSRRALTMREANLPLVHYIPREDAVMSLFTRTSRITYCPYKGEAAYFSLHVEGRASENAVWTYEMPFPEVAEIKGRLAFYPSKVDRIEEVDT